jgi:hypothetical protein
MGWKLSKIVDTTVNTSKDKDRKKLRQHTSTLRDGNTVILQNSFIGPKFNHRRRIVSKKNSDSDFKVPLEAVNQSMLVHYPNQIINLKAPTQFERVQKKDEIVKDIDKDMIKRSYPTPSHTSPQISKERRRPSKQRIKVDAKQNKTAYMSESSYFGSRLHDKITEFNKINGNLSPSFQTNKDKWIPNEYLVFN